MDEYAETYFNKEMVRFRKIMGDKTRSVDYVDQALAHLFLILTKTISDRADLAYTAVYEEWQTRKQYMVKLPADGNKPTPRPLNGRQWMRGLIESNK